jgi:hypothetical protein
MREVFAGRAHVGQAVAAGANALPEAARFGIVGRVRLHFLGGDDGADR